MTPHTKAVLNTEPIGLAELSELLDLVMMVADRAWEARDLVPAKRAYALALELDPKCVNALNRMGRIALLRREFHGALRFFRASWALDRTASTCVNFAIAFAALKDFRTALAWCDEAIKIDVTFLPAYIHEAAVFEETGNLAEAEKTVLAALNISPEDPELLYALSLYQLKRGDFENGWQNYENRGPRLELVEKLDEYPEWTNQGIDDSTILVCGEQGLGDQIMFARYLPLLQELGANVVFFTRPELARLIAHSIPTVRVVTSNRELDALKPDCWVALCSLPLRWSQFENSNPVGTPAAGAVQFPYLWADRADIDRFRSLIQNTGNLRVGLCWKGNPQHRRDEYRSMSWETMRSLLDIRGVDFYSLQQGDKESGLVNLIDYCHDVADTAAAIANLDMVVTVDTAMLHLGGAMGVLTFGLTWTPGDWRWGTVEGIARTPWYASVDLYGKGSLTDWKPAVEAIKVLLASKYAPEPRDSAELAISADARSPIVTRECRYGTMSWLRNDHYIGRALELYDEYSQSEVDLLVKLLKPGDVVVEAGANVGALTVPIAQAVGPNGRVVAYEPQPAYFRRLQYNTGRFPWVACAPMALGDFSDVITLRRIEVSRVHAPGWESAGESFEACQTFIDDGMNSPALIKIDVDGQELEILQGAEETIARCRPLVYVEYDKPEKYPDLMPWLHAHGYRLYSHMAPLYNPNNFRGNLVNVFGSLVSAMLLCVPNERKDLHPEEWGLSRVRLEKVSS